MGFLGIDTALTSLFTPSGTNARKKQEAGQQTVANQAGEIAKATGSNYFNSLNYAQGYDKQLQNGLMALAQSTTTAGLRNQALAAGNAARAQAMSQSVPMQYSTNPYLAQAFRSQNLNKAQDATNQALFGAYDPMKKQQALLALMQALGQYKSSYANDFSNAASLVYGQPAVQVQPGFMDIAGQALGAWAGGQMFSKTPSGSGGNGGVVGGIDRSSDTVLPGQVTPRK
jgi:hypothetical protein